MYEKNVGFFLGVQTVQALLVHIFQKKTNKQKTNQIIVHFIFYLWAKIYLTYPFSRWDQLAKKRNQGYRTEYT